MSLYYFLPGHRPRTKADPSERFWAKVDKREDGCWIWTAVKSRHGYGKFKLDGRMRPSHIVSYRWLVGEIPPGLHLDHLCRVRACVNPDHLEPVTPRENVRRALMVRAYNTPATECPNGHEVNEKNTYVSRDGQTSCRVCNREAQRRYRARRADT